MNFATKRIQAAVLGIALLGCLAGCEREGPAEETGEKIDEAAEDLGQQLEEAGEAAEDCVEDVDGNC